MNQQTRRDGKYTRNMEKWLDLYVCMERDNADLDARYAHINETNCTPEIEAAYNAEAAALAGLNHPLHASCQRELGSDMQQRIRTEARELLLLQDAPKEEHAVIDNEPTPMTPEEMEEAEMIEQEKEATVSEQFHWTMKETEMLGDRADEFDGLHPDDCPCDACEDVRAMAPADAPHDFTFACPHCRDEYVTACRQNTDYLPIAPQETTREYRDRLGRWTKGVLAGAALLTALALPGHASAREYPIIGTPAYDASCQIVTEWEDGGALSYCEEDGETYLFDADGLFYTDNGIRFYGRQPGTWFVAPERLQIGPGAPVDAR